MLNKGKNILQKTIQKYSNSIEWFENHYQYIRLQYIGLNGIMHYDYWTCCVTTPPMNLTCHQMRDMRAIIQREIEDYINHLNLIYNNWDEGF